MRVVTKIQHQGMPPWSMLAERHAPMEPQNTMKHKKIHKTYIAQNKHLVLDYETKFGVSLLQIVFAMMATAESMLLKMFWAHFLERGCNR